MTGKGEEIQLAACLGSKARCQGCPWILSDTSAHLWEVAEGGEWSTAPYHVQQNLPLVPGTVLVDKTLKTCFLPIARGGQWERTFWGLLIT